MSYPVRKIDAAIAYALVDAWNGYVTGLVSAEFHASVTKRASLDFETPAPSAVTITEANASDIATSLTLANALLGAYNAHVEDNLAHDSAASAKVTTAVATDLTTAQTLANALKAAYNTHRTEASVHFNNDATNAVAAADASDQGTLNTLLNELKTDFNAHIASAPAADQLRLVAP